VTQPADPLHTALAATLSNHGITNPATIRAATETAARILGRDRCTCRQSVHAQHHTTPVHGCPWCTTQPAATTIEPTGSYL
jgi:DNA-binding helix-hairpin-helix protein with protein kinase domain